MKGINMSFSSEQKQEIISHPYKSPCCRRALLSGYLFARGEILDGTRVRIKAEKEATIEFLSRLTKEFFGRELDAERSKAGGRYVYSDIDSASAAKYIRNLQENSLYITKCATCESSFLRGVFLGAGRITDPEKQYCLEFYLGDRTDIFASYLEKLRVTPSVSDKKTGRVLYYKNSSKIEDFAAFAAMNKTVFAIMNAKISGEIRNSVNRIANCETNNIGKAVKASGKHLEVITELANANLLSSLPEELERTARLRMEHPDYSLTQLSQIIVPPVSKSGLSHRLNKIVELSRSLLNKI
jgi:DNA-binding protein WhiA